MSGTISDDRQRRGNLSVVAAQELRDLWIGGRGLALVLAYSALLSVVTYLTTFRVPEDIDRNMPTLIKETAQRVAE